MKAYLFIAVLCNSALYGSQPLAPAHARKKSTLTKEKIGEFAVDFSFATRPSAKTVAKASPKSPSNKQ